MSRFIARLPPGLIAAAGISLAAFRLGALTPSGAIAATLTGSAVFAGTGLRGSAGMLAYFASSSALGRLPTSTHLEQRRGNRRDAVQVLANGGVPALLATISAIGPARARPMARAGFAGSLAAAAADTWATEIGSRARSAPRSIITLRHVPRGASGGITFRGLLASAAGALFIAAVLGAECPSRTHRQQSWLSVALAGFAGSLADSLLGATVQELRMCDVCGHQTERATCCGEPTRRIRGFAGVDNDVVNALSVMLGAAVTVGALAPHFETCGFSEAPAPGIGVRTRRLWTQLRRVV